MNWKTISRDAWRKRVGLDRAGEYHVFDSGGILFFAHSAEEARRKGSEHRIKSGWVRVPSGMTLEIC